MEIKVKILETAEGVSKTGSPFKSYRVMILIGNDAFRKTFVVFENTSKEGELYKALQIAEKGKGR